MISRFDKIISPVLPKLRIPGCHPYSFNLYDKLRWIIVLIFNIIWFIFIGVHLFEVKDPNEFTDSIISFCAVSQITVGHIVCRFYDNNYRVILNIMQHKFWYNEHNYSKKMYTKHIWYYKVLSKMIKSYLILISISAFIMVGNPLFFIHRKFIFDITFTQISFINFSPYYEIIYFLQLITVGMGVLSVLFQDVLFIASMGFVLIQIEFLKYRIKSVLNGKNNEDDIKNGLKECVEHHYVIIHFVKNIKTVLQFLMLEKFMCNFLVICCARYVLSFAEGIKIKELLIFISAILQILMYCFFGDVITSSCESIGQIAYEMQWEDHNMKHVKHVVLMIIRQSQEPILITAAGLIVLNLQNFVAFLKMMVSFYIILQKM